jgi:hypothetical protein
MDALIWRTRSRRTSITAFWKSCRLILLLKFYVGTHDIDFKLTSPDILLHFVILVVYSLLPIRFFDSVVCLCLYLFGWFGFVGVDNSHFVVSYLKFAVLNIFVNITVFYISINQVRDINMIGLLVIAVFFVYFSALYAQSYTDLSLLLPYR